MQALTREAIEKMEAGPEMDALVAERVMGKRFWKEKRGEYTFCVGEQRDGKEPWTSRRGYTQDQYTQVSATKAVEIGFFGDGIERYSRDMAAAWDVVQKMREGGWLVLMEMSRRELVPYTMFRFWKWGAGTLVVSHQSESESTEIAICRAALLATNPG